MPGMCGRSRSEISGTVELGRWLAKVRHYRGGESVLSSRETRLEAQADVDAWNERYQTDSAYVEEWDDAKRDWPTSARREFAPAAS